MKKLLQKFRDIFCYCGLSKEEYRDIKIEAYRVNFRVWKYLHLLIMPFFAYLIVFTYNYSGLSTDLYIRIFSFLYSIVAFILFWFVFDEDSLLAQFAIYFTMILLLCLGLWLGINRSGMMAVTFVVMLVVLSVFMIDKPYFMALLLSVSSIIYLIFASRIKTGYALKGDFVNVIVFCIVAIIINTFYNYIRIHEFKYKEQETKAYENVSNLNNTLKKMSVSLTDLLGNIVESRDTESGEHIQRVRGYTSILASQVMMDCPEYGLDKYKVELMTFSSSLHDVGKIAISDAILLKPGKLTPEEFNIMKTHCEKGCDIIRKMSDTWSKDYIEMGLEICSSHHEKWDGKGYPRGLKGDEIPISAQIVSIADIYDALVSQRVYKDAYTPEEAFNMIINGECGAFSEKLLSCLKKCRVRFEHETLNPDSFGSAEYDFEVTTRGGYSRNVVIGFHDDDQTLKEKNELSEELSVISSLSLEEFIYICYVDMKSNEVYRFKANDSIARILDNFGDDLTSNLRLDKLFNTIIVSEDFDRFRKDMERNKSMKDLKEKGYITTEFRIRLADGVHYCGLKITPDPNDDNAVILGIYNRDEAHKKENEYLNIQRELVRTKEDIENREKLEDRLAVINSLSDDYDYVCSLNADTMDVTVYHAEEWIKDMFKNIQAIVTSPEARNEMLKGIIYDEDFEKFKKESQHEEVIKNLAEKGQYKVTYRGYKFGELVTYQSKYTLDPDNPKRIIIGLHQIN